MHESHKQNAERQKPDTAACTHDPIDVIVLQRQAQLPYGVRSQESGYSFGGCCPEGDVGDPRGWSRLCLDLGAGYTGECGL